MPRKIYTSHGNRYQGFYGTTTWTGQGSHNIKENRKAIKQVGSDIDALSQWILDFEASPSRFQVSTDGTQHSEQLQRLESAVSSLQSELGTVRQQNEHLEKKLKRERIKRRRIENVLEANQLTPAYEASKRKLANPGKDNTLESSSKHKAAKYESQKNKSI